MCLRQEQFVAVSSSSHRRSRAMAAALLCVLSLMAAAVQPTRAECTSGFGDAEMSSGALPLPPQFVVPQTVTSYGTQVIVPGMVFNCHGYITAWRALTVLLSFTILDRSITFQLWRPQLGNGSFSLVDSEQFILGRAEVSPIEQFNTTQVNQTAYSFEFDRPSKQIYFQPGDVVGWYFGTVFRELVQPLSVAYRTATEDDDPSLVVDMYYHSLARTQLCHLSYCPGMDTEEISVVRNVVPYFSVDYEVLSEGSLSPSPTPVVPSCTSTTFPPCPSSSPSPSTPLPSPTTITPTPPGTGGLERMTLIIIAVVAPAALLMVLVFAACVLLLFCKRKQSCDRNDNEKYQDADIVYSSPVELTPTPRPSSPAVPHFSAQSGELYALPDRRPSPNSSESEIFDGDCYATTYQTNGQCHVYHELSETMATHRPSLASSRGSRPQLAQFPYSVPTLSMTTSYPYLEAEKRDSGFSLGSERTLQSCTESSLSTPPLRKQLFVALDDEGFHVPPAEDRRVSQGAEDLYSKLNRNRGSRDSRDSCSTFFEQSELFWEPPSSTRELYNQLAQRKYREIQRNQISVAGSLGEGYFGTVQRGVWQVPGGRLEAAVKSLKPLAPESERIKFLQEAAIMGQFLHPNVVKLHGVVTVGEPLMIVLEMMPKGDLKHFLRSFSHKSQPLPERFSHLLLNFCRQISFGMNYLSNKAFVHRDLAARNILLSEELTCKIGDFGMARDVAEDSVYHSQGGKIPLKWTAPEALHYRQFSSASDVWSYGMLLFEIWSLGRKPFERISTNKLLQLVNAGFCQPPPPGCPRALYQLMVLCWHPVAAKRPSFAEISDYLNSSDDLLLSWSAGDRAASPHGSELAAPLAQARNLYPDLQCTYTITDDLSNQPNYY